MQANWTRLFPITNLLTVVIAFVVTFCVSLMSAETTRADSGAAKNVIVLLADDLGWGDVGFHKGVAETPRIDQLAKEGVELSRFYAYPACSPARGALLTGRFPHRFGIVGPTTPRADRISNQLDRQVACWTFDGGGQAPDEARL